MIAKPLNKNLYFTALSLFLSVQFSVRAQQPFNEVETLFGDDEIAIIWNELNKDHDLNLHHQVINPDDLASLVADPDSVLLGENSGNDVYGFRHVAVETGNFNNDRFDDVVMAYVAVDGSIFLNIPQVNTDDYSAPYGTFVRAQGKANSTTSNPSDRALGLIRLKTGNLDDDPEDEILLAYLDSSSHHLMLEVYNTDGSLNLSFGGMHDAGAITGFTEVEPWDVHLADCNIDGKSEIATARFLYDGNGHDSSKVTLYGYPDFNMINSLGFVNLLGQQTVYVALTSGDLDRDTRPELILCIAWPGSYQSDDIQISTVSVDNDLQSMTLKGVITDQLQDDNDPRLSLDVATGNLNFSARDELVVGVYDRVKVYEFDDELNIYPRVDFKISSGDIYQYSNQRMGLGNGDKDATMELFVLTNGNTNNNPNTDQEMYLSVWKIDSTLNSASKYMTKDFGYISSSEHSQGRRYALALGDFDGDRVRLGAPVKHIKKDILQPLVILNAPPVHFDILDEVSYDVSGCYNGNSCGHSATYKWSAASESTASVKINDDWQASASLKAGGEYAKLGAEAKVEKKFGEKFERTSKTGQTIEVATEVTASEDDLIYATVCDYTIYEYPVYSADTFAGTFVYVRPEITENRWFPSKSWSGYRYIPDHEVGNVLSYREYGSAEDNPALQSGIKADFVSDAFTLDANSSYSWSLKFSDFTENEASFEQSNSLEIGAKVSGPGIEVEGSLSHETQTVSTSTTKVESNLELDVKLGNVNLGLGETGYTVRPYAYWATNGALVIDYDARPSLPEPGGTPTFWSSNYAGMQDPAFILPWKYDPEKGFALQDEEKRFQTKSITFSPSSPSAGDTVTITAWVHNFSFVDNQTGVAVSFYFGNPNASGSRITSIYGETSITSPPILARDRRKVTFDFVMPEDPSTPRIYGFLDPQEELDEIHENNNIGFNILDISGNGTDHIEFKTVDGSMHSVIRAYPNPGRDMIYLQKTDGNFNGTVDVRVMDIRGELVEHVAAGQVPTDVIGVNTADLPPGIYFIRISSQELVETKKVFILR